MLFTDTEKKTMASLTTAQIDLLIFIDEDGDVMCRAYTREGEDFLRSLHEGYERPGALEILVHPEEFQSHVVPGLRVGIMHPGTKIITLMTPPRLQ